MRASTDNPLNQGERALVGIVSRKVEKEEESQNTSDDQRQSQDQAFMGFLHGSSSFRSASGPDSHVFDMHASQNVPVR